MSVVLRIKQLGHLLLPPIITRWLARTKPSLPKAAPQPSFSLEYLPDGWKALNERKNEIKGWNVDSVVQTETAKWEAFLENCQGTGPLGFSHEHPDLSEVRNVSFHNVHMTYAYVLAVVSRFKTSLSVLDWGGALGHYYQLGKAVLPDLKLEFSCKEVPLMVEAGKRLNPEVHWYANDDCLDESFDLVMINGSLQYFQNWQETLTRLAHSAREYLFLTRLSVVDRGPSYLALQKVYETQMVFQQVNPDEVLEVARAAGFKVLREVVSDRPFIQGAPEQVEMRGWLFKRDSPRATPLRADEQQGSPNSENKINK